MICDVFGSIVNRDSLYFHRFYLNVRWDSWWKKIPVFIFVFQVWWSIVENLLKNTWESMILSSWLSSLVNCLFFNHLYIFNNFDNLNSDQNIMLTKKNCICWIQKCFKNTLFSTQYWVINVCIHIHCMLQNCICNYLDCISHIIHLWLLLSFSSIWSDSHSLSLCVSHSIDERFLGK